MTHVTDFLAKRAELSPDSTALIEEASGDRTSYGAWNERVNRTARLLKSLGVGIGDRVAIYSSNRVEYLDLIFATPKIGAILLNLNWRLTADELKGVIAEGDPTLLAYSPEWADGVDQLDSVLSDVVLMALGEPRPGERSLGERENLAPTSLPDLDLDLDHPWGIYPTGGTTGLPKGAVLTHGNITWNSINTVMSWGLHSGHTAPLQLPMFHIGGPNIFMLPLVHVGGTTVLCEGFDPGSTLNLIGSGTITHYVGVPTMHRLMLDHPDFPTTDFSKMELVISGGAPCPAPIMERYWARNVDFKTGYGLTEASGNNFWLPPEIVRNKPGFVGYPLFHVRARIMDEKGAECEADAPGELILSGPHVFAGYWKQPAETAAVIIDGWLHTGDVAVRDKDGAYCIIGRSKEMYISGGENVYPTEIESVIAAHPAVAEVAVIGVPDEKWGEVGAAFVAPRPGAAIDGDQLIAFCSDRLARYKLPKHFRILTDLPKTAIGKHDKKTMAASLSQGGNQ